MIRLRTLGAVDLQAGDGTRIRSVLAQPKRLALLAYLAIAGRGGSVRRDTLLALFWPELDATQGRAALSQALYYLRRSLGRDAVPGYGDEAVGVDPDRVWCDAVALEDALAEGTTDALTTAVELYTGELMPGFYLTETPEFERWLEAERRRLGDRAGDAAWALSERAESEGSIGLAVQWGRRALDFGGHDERRLRHLIRLLDGVGDRAGAVRVYEEVAEELGRAYELEPAPETQRLVAEVRARLEPSEGAREVRARRPRVEEIPEPAPTAADRRDSDGEPRSRSPLRPLLVAAAMVAVVGLVWQTASTSSPAGSDLAPRDRNRVAVLPLANLSPDPEDSYVADGLTAELITRFSRLRDLQVVPFTSVQGYRDSGRTVGEIARELGVGIVVEGDVRMVGSDVRVGVRLIEATDETVLWSDAYAGKLEELLDVQRQIAEAVARALKVENRAESDRRRALRSTSRVAYEEYLRGRSLLGKLDGPSLRAARDHFLRSIDHDPEFADAWSGLANAYIQLTINGELDGPDPWNRARRAAERALALDAELAEAHGALATVHSMFDWNAAEAERRFERAIALDPSYAAAHRGYATHLRNMGRFDEALRHVRYARALEPLSAAPVLEEAILLYASRRTGEAIDLVERLLADEASLDGFSPEERRGRVGRRGAFRPLLLLALLLTEQGEYTEALAALEEADSTGRRPDALGIRAYILARAGREDEARRILRVLGQAPTTPTVDFHRAVVHVALDEHGRALDLLDRVVRGRSRYVRLLGVEPKFDPLRGDPRFRDILVRAGLLDHPQTADPSAVR